MRYAKENGRFELLPIARDSGNGPLIVQFFAITCAWVGEIDLALKHLEIASPNSDRDISYGDLTPPPILGSPARRSRFEKIVASLAPK